MPEKDLTKEREQGDSREHCKMILNRKAIQAENRAALYRRLSDNIDIFTLGEEQELWGLLVEITHRG